MTDDCFENRSAYRSYTCGAEAVDGFGEPGFGPFAPDAAALCVASAARLIKEVVDSVITRFKMRNGTWRPNDYVAVIAPRDEPVGIRRLI